MIDSILLPALGVVALCATLIVVISTVLYIRLNRKFVLLSDENARLKKSSEEEAQKILDAAHLHANEVVKNATVQAQKILSEAQSFDTTLRNHALKVTTDVIAQENQAVMHVIEEVKQTGQAAVSAAGQKFTEEVSSDLTQFKSGLEGEFKKEYQAITTELAQYKQTKMKETEEKVASMLERILTKSIASSLTRADQEELVKKALLSISHEYES